MERPRLTALLTGCAMTLTGCHSSWINRVDFRPTTYGSLADHHDYSRSGPSHGYRPWYHFGSPDGICDRNSVRHAAVAGANQQLAEQFAGTLSSDFEFGFQQAFIDIANGGSGTLPTVPPPRYWTAPYRTSWGHDKAREWFAGYQAGAESAHCGALREAQMTPTADYRRCDPQITVGLPGGTSAPMAPFGWNPYGINPYGSGRSSMPPASSLPMFSAPGDLPTNAVPNTVPMNMVPPSTIPQDDDDDDDPQDAVPQSLFPQDAVPQSWTPQIPIPQSTIPQKPSWIRQIGMRSTVPQNTVLQDTVTQSTTPQSTPPPDVIPLSTFLQDTTSQNTTPQNTTSQSTTSQNSVPPQKALPPSNRWRRFWKIGPSGVRSEGESR